MAQIKILVVEDEVIIADGICKTLKELGYKPLRPVINYTGAVKMLEKGKPDLVMLDINLAGRRDGIDLAWKIRDDYDIPFIFLTSLADPATIERAKKVNPPAYLVKPFNKNELYTTIEIALYNFSQNQAANTEDISAQKESGESEILLKDALFVKHKQSFQKILFSDILFLKSEHVYVKIVTKEDKEYLIRTSMLKFLEQIPDYFFQIQRSHVVNLNAIENIAALEVQVGKHRLPFGQGYRAKLLEKLNIK